MASSASWAAMNRAFDVTTSLLATMASFGLRRSRGGLARDRKNPRAHGSKDARFCRKVRERFRL